MCVTSEIFAVLVIRKYGEFSNKIDSFLESKFSTCRTWCIVMSADRKYDDLLIPPATIVGYTHTHTFLPSYERMIKRITIVIFFTKSDEKLLGAL